MTQRTPEEMMNLILSRAENDAHIRVVGMEGSRTNQNIPKDRFQDFDVTYFVDDPALYTEDDTWVNVFGERLIMQKPEDMELFPAVEEGYSFLMFFTDYNKIDLTILPLTALEDYLNGDGLRTVLWVAGCSHGCKNCHNPITWDICGGIPFDDAAREELFAELSQPYISGVTMSGGDPLHMANRDEIGALIKEIHETFPDKTIWIYTGYLWEEVKDLPFMPLADVLVDGPFIEEQKDTALHWKGSANQRVIDVKQSLAEGRVVLHA